MRSTELGGIANLALLVPVKRGFVPNAEGFSHVKRLETLFKTLNALRTVSRESSLSVNPFPDALGRWGILHSFRYALIPPEIGSDGGPAPSPGSIAVGTYRLYLNVTFDGGWEPYMRVIYRDLGSLLDTIFCNCVGYRASSRYSYGEYIEWVRSREISAGVFYTESPKTVLDQRYLEEVDRMHRHAADSCSARRDVAGFALRPPPDLPASLAHFQGLDDLTKQDTVANNLRALKGLYDLRALYPDNDRGDARCLWRFARDAMPEFSLLMAKGGADPRFDPYREQITWLLEEPAATTKIADPGIARPAAKRANANTRKGEIQTGILSPHGKTTHGCLFLLAVTDAVKARKLLACLPVTTEEMQPLPEETMHCNLAFTRQGLLALDVEAESFAFLPQEFVDGMEPRAGLLGDVRGNHPDHWRRPKYKGVEIDLGSVHVVVHYRFAAADELDRQLHSKLAALANQFGDASGFRLLSTEALRSYPVDNTNISREHFGFQDGFSQPAVRARSAQPLEWDDAIARGELLLGHPNDRGDGPYPPQPDKLLDNGSFLVLRKIRQHVDRWRATLCAAARAQDAGFDARPQGEQRAAIDRAAGKLMGRSTDGAPVVDATLPASTNDFNYDDDSRGSRCPFQSHIRRANPRLAGPRSPIDGSETPRKTPRLVRRGMSYGLPAGLVADPQTERGLYFMAYCGSIAEQFEIVQRWMAGGNSSGVLSLHSDPMLGVPQRGVPRSMQWAADDGSVVQVNLGDEPITRLEWGLYLFVPSRTGLAALTRSAEEPPAKTIKAAPAARLSKRDRRVKGSNPNPDGLESESYDPRSPHFAERKQLLQDRDQRDRFWRRINGEADGQLQTAYGLLMSKPDDVLGVLRDCADKHSVCGYGRRFTESIGLGYLGMDKVHSDPAKSHDEMAECSGINEAITQITEKVAFGHAQRIAEQVLVERAGQPGSARETAVDVNEFAEVVIARLCTLWFGVPDGKHLLTGFNAKPIVDQVNDTPCCPRDFVFVARHIFGPHPSAPERARGIERGRAIHEGLERYLETRPDLPDLSAAIFKGVGERGLDVVAQNIAGVMLGFGPSVHGNYVNLMRAWVEHRQPDTDSIWDLQIALLDRYDATDAETKYISTRDALRPRLMKQMRREPVPAMVWREKPSNGSTRPVTRGEGEPEKIVIGLHGVMQDPNAAEELMFGGSRTPGPLKTQHACPGHGMATGVLLGIVSSILLAGTLRATPSPTLLNVVR
jgi:Dyp-type peroxidase family